MVAAHGRFVWYELMTTDVDAAKAFYGRTLAWTAREAPETRYVIFAASEEPVAGATRLGPAAGAPHWIGYVGVDDVDKSAETARALGGAIYRPPTDIAGISRFAVVGDPQGAALALVKGRKTPPGRAGALDEPGRVGWHELLTADWRAALAFYSALFGWKKAAAHTGFMGAYQQFAVGAQTIGGMFDKPPELPFPFWLYYFNVEAIEPAAERVEAGGGHVHYGPIEAPGGAWIAHCADPQGAVFALLERRRAKPVGYFVTSVPERRAPRGGGASARGTTQRELRDRAL